MPQLPVSASVTICSSLLYVTITALVIRCAANCVIAKESIDTFRTNDYWKLVSCVYVLIASISNKNTFLCDFLVILKQNIIRISWGNVSSLLHDNLSSRFKSSTHNGVLQVAKRLTRLISEPTCPVVVKANDDWLPHATFLMNIPEKELMILGL